MMRIVKIILAAVVAICLIAVAGVYVLSEMRLSRTYDVAAADFTVKTTLSAEEAERRARTLMCGGCHHDAGYVLLDEPGVGRIVAPNLTRFVPMYSDAELVRLIRHGVKKDGTGAVIMPASNFANISDDDMAAIITAAQSEAAARRRRGNDTVGAARTHRPGARQDPFRSRSGAGCHHPCRHSPGRYRRICLQDGLRPLPQSRYGKTVGSLPGAGA